MNSITPPGGNRDGLLFWQMLGPPGLVSRQIVCKAALTVRAWERESEREEDLLDMQILCSVMRDERGAGLGAPVSEAAQ